MQTSSNDPTSVFEHAPESISTRSARERLRIIKDRVFAAVMAVGGIAVIVAILLIFLYLFYVVWPLFEAATITSKGRLSPPRAVAGAYVALDEYAEIAFDVSVDGRYRFITLDAGRELAAGSLLGRAAADGHASVVAAGAAVSRSVFVGTDDGRVAVARADYAISYPDDQRLVTPSVELPLGPEPLVIDDRGASLRLLTGQFSDDETTAVAVTEDGRVMILNVIRETSFLDDEVSLNEARSELAIDGRDITHLALDIDQRELFVVDSNGTLAYYDITDKSAPALVDRESVVTAGSRVTALEILSGGISILIGDDQGRITQWFPVRDENNLYALARVRGFDPMPSAVVRIEPEHFRKGFAAVDVNGNLALYHATAGQRVAIKSTGLKFANAIALSPLAGAALVVAADGDYASFAIHNEHPEVSLAALWGKIWYESRAGPEYIWQSSSASSDFEPKFSLTPLTFGTFKATFYSMLFAIPLAVFGAIYTAYFMTPALRNVVKPSIEVMAALPTVILGFLAGLWLAPLVERELLGLFLALALVPLAILAASLTWTRSPPVWRQRLPEGWEAVLLLPVICIAAWASLQIGSLLEVWFFDGSLAHWLTREYGLAYDQRNSLVVGIAIGFAVIPTIFSISEDAVFSVPRSLTMGSLALGATPWQTALRVVLLTASPGIFSAVMIGMGRAVGETMIVLMATGNTPIMDVNIFQGFRALSANIAVEMPESEVNSTHYRILFLAALVLFLVTFAVNTLAEVVRQRLRRKYASL